MKTSSAEKSTSNNNTTGGQFVTYSNFSTQEYSATQSNNSYGGAQGTLSHNAFDELKLQQLQYQKVFLKHNQLPHNLPRTQVKVSAAGLPLQDAEYNNEKRPFHLDDEPIIDDGENSQLDLVEYASKH